MNKLMQKMLAKGSIKQASVLSESEFFNEKDFTKTDLPILNLAFSGKLLDGGFATGLTIIAGPSRSFKTLLALYCLKAYLDSDEDAIGCVYDSEFGITPDYLKANGINPDRIVYIPVDSIETLKFDMVKRLEDVERGDKVFFLVDSIGSLASKKEIDDAKDEKTVADMTRAKSIRSFLRIVGPTLTMKNIPCFAINHIYNTMELYSKAVVSGGTAVMYSANQVFIITKAQEKEGDEIVGYNFTINIEKSRFVRERSKFPFTVRYDSGIEKYSGLFDLAMDTGHIIKPKVGWYQRVIPDKQTGEIAQDKLWRRGDTNTEEFWAPILTQTDFADTLEQKVKLGAYVTDQEGEVDK